MESDFENRSKMTFTKLDQAGLDSPRRELSNAGLGIVVPLLVRWQINSVWASTGGSIQLYLTGVVLWSYIYDHFFKLDKFGYSSVG